MNIGVDQPKTWSCEGHAEPWAIKPADEGLLTGKPSFGLGSGRAAEGFLGLFALGMHSTSSSGWHRGAKDRHCVRRCCWQQGCLGTGTIFQWEVVEQ